MNLSAQAQEMLALRIIEVGFKLADKIIDAIDEELRFKRQWNMIELEGKKIDVDIKRIELTARQAGLNKPAVAAKVEIKE